MREHNRKITVLAVCLGVVGLTCLWVAMLNLWAGESFAEIVAANPAPALWVRLTLATGIVAAGVSYIIFLWRATINLIRSFREQ